MKVLFICPGNVDRSQMAEAYFNKFSKKSHATSAGFKNYYYRKFWHAKIKTGYGALRAMRELGMDISKNRIKKLTKDMIDESDIVIGVLGRDEAENLPSYVKTSKKYRLWEIKDDCIGTSFEAIYRWNLKNSKIIKSKVKRLIEEIDN